MQITILIILVAIGVYILFILKNLNEKYSSEKIDSLNEKISETKTMTETLIKGISQEISRTRIETTKAINESINSLNSVITSNLSHLSNVLNNSSNQQKNELKIFSENLNSLIKTIDSKLKDIMENNEKKLEEMRKTVDEKLQSTLEKRLSESFKNVSLQLENVYRGIGEMSKLASDVGDLKRVLTNVKQRGIFGELQLKRILEDILTEEQYLENIEIKKGSKVEFAIKIPSKNLDDKDVLLPIDSKYPREDYEKILNAEERGNVDEFKQAIKNLENRIKTEAKDIHNKYIDPPNTTDFAILFLPVEGLFAEVLRIGGLFEEIRNDYNVIITGPTTITAILNSLQMGFRTLAIEKKSNEVWKVLSAIKTEFIKFGDYLSKTRKKLEDAADEIEKAEKRTSIIGKKLRNVETIPYEESQKVLEIDDELDLSDEK
jgi:DNA recombination protein RmuC